MAPDTPDVRELAAAIADELENRRQLAGFLLVDVSDARAKLREVDDVLRRVERAIESAARAESTDPSML